MYKQFIKGKKAVLFDLDGTIVDTHLLWSLAVQKTLEDIGVNWITSDKRYVPGVSLESLWKNLIEKHAIKTDKTIEELVKKTEDTFAKYASTENIEARSGFWPLVYELKMEKGLKIALLTNSAKKAAMPVIEKLNATSVFDLITYGDDIKNPKPDPEIYLDALQKLGIKPNEALVFEDSPTGVEAARKADLEMVVIWNDAINKEGYIPVDFKGKIFTVMPDFTALPGNLDLTYREWYDFRTKQMKEKEKEMREKKASDIGKDISKTNQ